MSKLKSFDEFVNENLVTKGEYNFYGPGSLKPIIMKLIGEGKEESIIRTYLYSIGVAPWRIEKAFEEMGAMAAVETVSEAAKPTFEENATKFLSDINEEELKGHAKKMKEDGVSDEEIKKMHPEVSDEDLKEGNESASEKKQTFEENVAAFLLGLSGSDAVNDKEQVEEKLNKETLQVEGDGEDIDDMIDDLDDGDEDEYQGSDDNAPDDSPEKKIKDGESPADAVEGDEDSPTDKLANAAKELAKDSKKLEKIKKLLGEKKEAEEVEIEADGDEVELKADMEDEETGDEIQVEEPAEESVKESKEEKANKAYVEAVTEGLKSRFTK